MIKIKNIIINTKRNNKKYYEKLGYDTSKEKICIKIEHLSKGSHITVDVYCDYCGKNNKIKYNDYNHQISKGGKYSCSKCYPIKIKENNIIKYGVDSTNKLEITQKKKNKTVKEKYGVNNISEISQEKVRKTKLEKYGNEKYNNRIKAIETTMNKYGVTSYTYTDDYITKSKKTNLKKYGFEHFSQNPIIHRKQQIGGYMAKRYKDLYFRGSYELDFIKYCELNNINIINGPTIEYSFNNKKKYYFSDFILPKYNLVCEIKSTYYYNKNLEINLLKKDATLKTGYNFIFILDKNYNTFIKKLEELIIINSSNFNNYY